MYANLFWMKIKMPLTRILLDSRRKKSDGTYPVKLRVTFNREQRLYPIGLSLSEKQFKELLSSEDVRGKNKEKKRQMIAAQEKADQVIDKLTIFGFDAFERKFLISSGDDSDVIHQYETAIKEMRMEGRIGNASSYECSMNALKDFHGKPYLSFHEVSPEFLKKFESWMINRGRSHTTVGIYLRTLRALFNKALEASIITREFYPYGRTKYVIPAGRNIKKALKIKDVQKLLSYQAIPDTTEYWAHKLWLFSYLCNGMNINDIANLKYKDIEKDRFYFYRGKTINTSKQNLKKIEVLVTPPVREIIDSLGTKPKKPDSYIFGIIEDPSTPLVKRAKIHQATKQINKYIKRIAVELDIEMSVSTMTARHTFATIMLNLGSSPQLIGESLGHANISTTQNYLGSFEDDIKRKFADQLYNL